MAICKEIFKKWYSHKFKGPGVRYEIGVAIKSGDIVWIAGPYPCGKYNDLMIFEEGLMHELDENERVECDDGYKSLDPFYTKTRTGFSRKEEKAGMQNTVRARHETVNKRLKQWECLAQPFRHDLKKHTDVLRAVAVIAQMAIENNEPLFGVDYN